MHRPKHRQWQFERSLLEAVEVGSLEIAQLLAKHFGDCSVSRRVVIVAASCGLTEVLAWMDEWGCDIEWCADAVSDAIRNGFFELANWLQGKLSPISADQLRFRLPEWAKLAADKGNLDMVKQICERLMERNANGNLCYSQQRVDLWGVVRCATDSGHFHILQWMMDEPNRKVLLYELCGQEIEGTSGVDLASAADRGDIDVIAWLVEHYPKYCITSHAVYNAAQKGYLDILRLLISAPIKIRPIPMGPNVFAVSAGLAARYGHLDIVKFLQTEGYPFYKAMEQAAENGHLEIVKWLHDNTSHSCSTDAMDGAASNGHLDVVKWLHDNREEGCTTRAMDGAAGQGHLEVVQWLHENRTEGCTASAMDEAARAGNLEMIVKWLHDNTSHSCSTAAMDDAASNGHLDVVKWLHDNREEGCTARAMDGAAGQGHLEVVQWLDENRTEGCTASAMDEAARAGNLEMVKWLHFNRSEGCTTTAMDSAAGNGHLDVVKWLHSNRMEGCTTEAMDLAAENNHLEVLKWLDQNRTEGFTAEAMHQAVCCGNFEVLQWLFSRRPDLFVASLMNDAVSYGRFDIVWFLYQNHCECSSIEFLKKALWDREGFAEWAYTHHRQEFERNIAEPLFAD
eukprot:jgi/Phyca11/543660/estExt2_Genewise1Plus.C_PHYCAscaffold_120613